MRQGSVNLLPDALRARSQAGLVAGRYVVALLIAVILVGLTATHSRLILDLSRQRVRVAEDQADLVLAAEANTIRLRARLTELSEFIDEYEQIALPIEVSRVIATIVNQLPPSVAVERVDMYAGVRRSNRSVRERTDAGDEQRARILTGELSGFAASDQDVAETVAHLEALPIFQEVSLDFSRTRTVRAVNAREFRISFFVDLNVNYDIEELETPRVAVGMGGNHVE